MSRSQRDPDDTLAAVVDRLLAAPAGLHQLNDPARDVRAGLPAQLADLYTYLDGAELFHGSMIIFPCADVTEANGRYHFGCIEADEVYLDSEHGRVWRLEADTGELLEEGSRLHRWLLGFIEGESTMYDDDGEYAEDVFGDDSRPTPEFVVRRERRLLKRDRDAIAPRWRLARALSQQDRLAAARDHLELVVAARPSFSWAWYDLSRISESLNEIENATLEMETAATADTACDYRGFFWAHCARLAQAHGDEETRKSYAARALGVDPNLVRAHVDGACERLDAEDAQGAKVLVDLALALAPLDVATLDLRAQVDTALGSRN